jgi:hypothetical protein
MMTFRLPTESGMVVPPLPSEYSGFIRRCFHNDLFLSMSFSGCAFEILCGFKHENFFVTMAGD